MLETETVPEIKPATGADHRLLTSPTVVIAAAIVALGFTFFRYTLKYSVNVLYWDQWDFLTPLFHQSWGLRELFLEQLGPHREGVGLIADSVLYAMTHWNTRAESIMIAGFIFLAMLLSLALKRNLFGPITYSDLAIPLMFLTLAQWETLTGTPNPAHSSFPLVMIMLYCLALLLRNRLLRYGLVLLLNFLLIYTGFGLFMGVITLGIFALEVYWQLRRMPPRTLALPFAGFIVAGASLGSFFFRYKFLPAADCFVFPYHPVTAYWSFIALMFWEFVGPANHWVVGTSVGTILLVFAGMVLSVQARNLVMLERPPLNALIVAVLLGYSLLFTIGSAVGRVCLGRQAAETSRYTTLLIPAFLALYFYLLSLSHVRLRKLALGLFVAMLIPSALTVRKGAHWIADGKRAWATCYLQSENIDYCDTSVRFKIHPYPEYNNGLKEKLDYLKQHRLNLFADSTFQ
jgi:hypothetical protein